MELLLPSIADAEEIAAVHVRSWQVAYSGILPAEFLTRMSVSERAASWSRILAVQESSTVVAKTTTGEIAGFVSYGKCRDAGTPQDQGEIWALYAEPRYWNQGVGRALLTHALCALTASGSSSVSLWVLCENSRGIKFYKAAGFTEVENSAKRFELGGATVEEVCLVQRDEA